MESHTHLAHEHFAHQGDQSNIIEHTYHSLIEVVLCNRKKVVVKRCRTRDDRASARCRREAQALELAGAHANITQLLAFNANELTITLRFEPGQSLNKYVDAEIKSLLSPADGGVMWKQMASALAHLHARSIIHDDVKPENIVWSAGDNRAVLIDFGAALHPDYFPKGTFNPSGTPSYAPPEFLHRKKDVKGDVWGLGIVVLFAFRYAPLPDGEWLLPAVFEDGKDRMQMLKWLESVQRLRDVVAEANQLLSEMLDVDPESRIASSELSRLLEV